MWLGSATLAALLLASSLTASASSQTSPATATAATSTGSSMKHVLTASSFVPSRTYTEAVRKELQWISSPAIDEVKVEADAELPKSVPTPSDSVTVAAVQPAEVVTAQPAKVAAAQPAKVVQPEKPKKVQAPATPVQVAEAPKLQISRSDSSSLVDNARSLTGVPYVYGGTSRSGFDCSGYTQYVYKGSGISLPRTSSSQYKVGSSVKKAQLQEGDLVFFATNNSGPSHVGIYIGGESFIHASNSGVRTSSLSEGYYADRYLGARRP
ncbi:peptidoglycan endopeptidase [Desulfosporosinus fructosivorans]|uniref:Peptidoglycan endopeptidase n=1 Tax=Desulfosporosinus fructosivorans TaxID=2018669 RepID=A0A4Z0R3M2_9FIRM|nr:peptidoglycan endopeptidase [Desulfosporosinus fructosivorans]